MITTKQNADTPVFDRIAPFYNLFMRCWGFYQDTAVASLLMLQDHETIVDIGGGTGHYAHTLAPLCAQYIITDPSAGMLKRYRGNLANVTCRQQTGSEVPVINHSADVILLHDVLHHVDSIDSLLLEVRRVIKPSGRVLVYDFDAAHKTTSYLITFEKMLFKNLHFYTYTEIASKMHEYQFKETIVQNNGYYFISIWGAA